MLVENNTTTKHLEVTMSDNNQIEQIKQFLYKEICERRDYSASKMCEEVIKFIEQMDNNETPNLTGLSKIFWGDSNTCDVTFYPKDTTITDL